MTLQHRTALPHADLCEVGHDTGVKLVGDVLGGCEAASWALRAEAEEFSPLYFLRFNSR